MKDIYDVLVSEEDLNVESIATSKALRYVMKFCPFSLIVFISY